MFNSLKTHTARPPSHPHPSVARPMTPLAVLILFVLGALGDSTDPAGQRYLAENAKKDGVVVLPSGLQYKVMHSAPPGGATPVKRMAGSPVVSLKKICEHARE